ncbi:Na(+)-translocating NADH-quinone reductase subunit C [Robiginitalea sp. M366]|uniref:Na(+)-translocating NADH-quinone reductase subunit C n=1 Tax=Robiginitalea aestuariiviva TaxID=3036903 RepID=UPI00240D982B|nr:Na(+)-translocating NADH-quinone reductase subunit C [Robiginitalea aestuariiviva]MDG1570811.1 Na(+)-translocating NADH-quinone reductase subunit C [Robiginitalea aestuariiviva]
MALNTDKNVYTVLFAAVMVAVVGTILAFAASGLKPRIKENERFEKQQNILYAMGVNENTDEGAVNFIPTDRVEQTFSEYIVKQIVIEGGDISENPEAYLIDMKKQISRAKEGETPSLPVMIGEKDGKTFYVIPMYGKGLWDAIWGFIALDENMVVQGVYFDHKGETPGLGANIKARYFMDDFTGESIMDNGRYAGIAVAKGNNDPLNQDKEDNQVDALAGATITGNGITAMISETLKLYKDYLQTIRK